MRGADHIWVQVAFPPMDDEAWDLVRIVWDSTRHRTEGQSGTVETLATVWKWSTDEGRPWRAQIAGRGTESNRDYARREEAMANTLAVVFLRRLLMSEAGKDRGTIVKHLTPADLRDHARTAAAEVSKWPLWKRTVLEGALRPIRGNGGE